VCGSFNMARRSFARIVRDKCSARFLERLAAGDVVEMVVAVDNVLDRFVGDFLISAIYVSNRLRAAVSRSGRSRSRRPA